MATDGLTLHGFADAISLYTREAPVIITEEVRLLGVTFAEETKSTAQGFLDHYVYSNPKPWQTHRTYNAVKARVYERGGEMIAEAYVDRDDFRYPYFLVLEYGTDNWHWWGEPAPRPYHPRPFWRDTKAVMRERYLGQERSMMARITTRINGRFA